MTAPPELVDLFSDSTLHPNFTVQAAWHVVLSSTQVYALHAHGVRMTFVLFTRGILELLPTLEELCSRCCAW